MDGEVPRTPLTAGRVNVSDATVQLQLQQFLDDWHYRFVSSSLGKTWNRNQVVGACLDIFAMNGLVLSETEREEFPYYEEMKMIDELVDRMPEHFRSGFEHFSLQMQMIMQLVTRVRKSLDAEDPTIDPISSVVEEIDGTHIGQQILQMAVVSASREVANIQVCQATWIANTERRVQRLQNSAEMAEHAQQQLLAVEAQLESMNASTKGKSKQMLVGMADGNEKALKHTVFTQWLGLQMKMKAEAGIRKKFTDQIEMLENKLYAFKERKLAGVRSHFIRQANENKGGLQGSVFQCWSVEVNMRKRDGDTAAELKKMQDRLAESKDGQAAKTKATLTRMCGAKDGMLVSMVFQAFQQFHAEYQRDKEFEDQVKATEKALKEHMDSQKGKRQGIIAKLNAGTDTGLLSMCIQAWIKDYEETKQMLKLEEAMGGSDGRFKSLAAGQQATASSVQGRVNEMMKTNLLVKVFGWWLIEARCNSIGRHYSTKIDSKRRQLQGVQTLFKSFSQQLEAGLGNVDGDSSGRGSTSKKRQQSLQKGPDAVSLPDIHARPVVA